MNRFFISLRATEALAILFWWLFVAVCIPRLLVGKYELWGSPISVKLSEVEFIFLFVFPVAFIGLSFLSSILTKIYNFCASSQELKPYLGLQVFEYRRAAVALICAGIIFGACLVGHRNADRTQNFVALYHFLNGHTGISEMHKLISINAEATSIKKLHEEISTLAGSEFEIHFIRNRQVLLLWDVPTKKTASDLFMPRTLVYPGFVYLKAGQPYAFDEILSPRETRIPLVGLMRFNTPDGELEAFVETPPNIVTFTPPQK